MSQAGKSVVPLDIVDAKSPATQYLVRLLEEKGAISFRPLTDERIQLVFQVMDNITPQLGIFSRVTALIRTELHDAVYSQSDGFIHVPFFSVVRRMQTERNGELERFRSELNRVNAVLSEREEELLSLRKNICAIQETSQTLQAAIAALRLEAKESGRKIKRLEEEFCAQARQLEVERQTQQQSMTDLQNRLDMSHIEIQQMEQLNAAYCALQRVFQAPLMRKKQNMLSAVGKGPVDRMGPSQTHVTSYLQVTRHMYQQLLLVQNRVMDGFDCFLENRICMSETEESHMQQDDETETIFLSRLAEISEELLLLNQQRESLEELEVSFREVSSTVQNLNGRCPDLSNPESQEKTIDQNIEPLLSQALYPDESLLNRYAAMIYTSTDNGRIYEELAGAGVCVSCMEKTLLCPHKVGGSQVIHLPKNCTHIKICRPRAHQATMEAKIAASKAMSPVTRIPGKGDTEITHKSLEKPGSQSAAASCRGSQATDIDFSKLEKDFEKQLKLKRDVHRIIAKDLCLSLAQQLIVTMILQLDGKLQSLHLQDTVWEFFTKRYVNEDISSRGLQDFFTALRIYSSDSKVLCLLGLVLQRDLDPTILCYVLLKAEMVNLSPLTDMGQFQLFLHTQYPFLEDTEEDSLVLEFTAYSRRCVTPPSVMGFILHLILQHQEPLITECEEVLSTHRKTHAGYLTIDELSGALDEMCPLRSKMQLRSFIQRSVALTASSLIPLHKAARIQNWDGIKWEGLG